MKEQTFDEWMKQVDAVIYNYCGLSHEDLPDVCYMDMHGDGVSAKSAARQAIRNAKGEDALE